MLNESAAGALFPGQSALERYVRTADPTGLDIVRGGSAGQVRSEPVTCRVVGVAEDAKFGNVREAPPRTIYFPLTPDLGGGNLVFLLNSRTKAGAISAYREALREIAPRVPLVLFATLREQMNAALGGQRAITMLSVFFGIVALLLSALGLYGMLASSVSQRRAEIGVRTALGATRAGILRMIVAEALQPRRDWRGARRRRALRHRALHRSDALRGHVVPSPDADCRRPGPDRGRARSELLAGAARRVGRSGHGNARRLNRFSSPEQGWLQKGGYGPRVLG